MKKALVTGACGQDGFFLTRYLKSLGYDIYAGVRHDCEHLRQINCTIHHMDMTDYLSVQRTIRKVDPDEIYNLAGQSFVPPSWDRPNETIDVNTNGLARLLECVEKYNKKIKVYQASSSEMFGNRHGASFEDTPMIPTSVYGVSKLAAHRLCSVYRQKGLFVVGGICFNHESEHRGEEMVTRKITKHIARWVHGDTTPLKLGSTDTYRDWGYAGDYVKVMHAIMQLPEATDFVIATGEIHSIEEFLYIACTIANVKPIVELDERFIRTGEIKQHLGADIKLADAIPGIRDISRSVTFRELVKIMVEHDIEEESKRRKS